MTAGWSITLWTSKKRRGGEEKKKKNREELARAMIAVAC